MMAHPRFRWFMLIALALLVSCGEDDSSGVADVSDAVDGSADDSSPPDGVADLPVDLPEDTPPDEVDDSLYRPGVVEVGLEVDYEPGAEPYTSGVRIQQLWSLFESNAAALFAGQGISLDVPYQLSDMEQIADLPDTDFGVARLLEIANANRDDRGSVERHVFYVLFVDGYYQVDGERRDNVLGVSIGSTGVIAMFKPVIENSSASKFVEQAVLVHEFGHAVGLVNNGIPAVADHIDEEHGAHCSNDRCVMYWLNEGAADMAEFSDQYVETGDTVLFDQDCLDDVHAAFE